MGFWIENHVKYSGKHQASEADPSTVAQSLLWDSQVADNKK